MTIPHTTKTSVAALAAGALLLSGCSGGPSGPNPNGGGSDEEAKEVTSIPHADAFGEPVWSIEVENEKPEYEGASFWSDEGEGQTQGDRPMVTANRILSLTENKVQVWDADGEQAWEVDVESDDDPMLRQVDEETVALITTAAKEGETEEAYGDEDSVLNFSLLSLEDGSETASAEVPMGVSSVLAEYGLLAVTSDPEESPVEEEYTLITPDGKTKQIELEDTSTDEDEDKEYVEEDSGTPIIAVINDSVISQKMLRSQAQTGTKQSPAVSKQ